MSAVVQFRKVARQQGGGAASQSHVQSEAQSLDAQSMEVLGRVVSSVAHDFNNLITGVLLYSELLSKELPPESRLQRHVQGIHRAGVNGAALIQQLLTVARPQSSEAELLSINIVIDEMHDLLARLVGENIEIAVEKEPDLGRVEMSSAQMQRVLINLVLNARDAMPDGGRITLRTHAVPNTSKIELIVSDPGIGMSEEVRARLYEPFFTTKQPGRGTGLGLFAVQNIVAQSGGKLWVESEPGKGTCVTIRLPRADMKIRERNRKKR
jgi:two-component system, cell cycle sensor histidine kinase and response regulator CckA